MYLSITRVWTGLQHQEDLPQLASQVCPAPHGKQAQPVVIVFCLSRVLLWNKNLLYKTCSRLLPHKQKKKKKTLGGGATGVVLLGEGLCVLWHTPLPGFSSHPAPRSPRSWGSDHARSVISRLLRGARSIISSQEA